MKRASVNVFAAALMVLAIGLGGAGCRHRSSSAGMEGDAATVLNPDGSVTVSKFVVINNQRLANGLQIVDLKTGFAENGMMMANVTLVSKARRTLTFQYRFAWFDDAGMELDPDASSWKPMTLYGNESRTIQGVAPNAAAKQYRVKLRKL